MELHEFVAPGGLFVLTGAGMSTESGIPDYRRKDGTRRTIPMTFQQFMASSQARQRYWVRSAVGWETFSAAEPNRGHRAVTRLQERGLLGHVVTQNVDGLHQRAGTQGVHELHGSLASVICVDCGVREERSRFQERVRSLNPMLPARAVLLADGDAEVAQDAENSFVLVRCERCGSDAMKPDVVMFGESVERSVVDEQYACLERARAVLVLGSSLKVMSGYRFVLEAYRSGTPVALVGLGDMRGEDRADLVVREPLGVTLTEVVDRLEP